MFTHIVFFWLTEDAEPEDRERLVDDCRDLLGKIPVVRQLYTGRPAMTPRPIVDNSYDVGLCVILDDKAAHDVYLEHGLHKDFIARNKPKWARVLVYDFA